MSTQTLRTPTPYVKQCPSPVTNPRKCSQFHFMATVRRTQNRTKTTHNRQKRTQNPFHRRNSRNRSKETTTEWESTPPAKGSTQCFQIAAGPKTPLKPRERTGGRCRGAWGPSPAASVTPYSGFSQTMNLSTAIHEISPQLRPKVALKTRGNTTPRVQVQATVVGFDCFSGIILWPLDSFFVCLFVVL